MSKPTLPQGATIENGIWLQVLSSNERGADWMAGRPALVLDRDGVVVVEVNYLGRPEDARLIPGAAELIKAANSRNIPVVIVTNQAGIARGYYDWEAFAQVQAKVLADLSDAGAKVDGVFACPFHKDGKPPFQHPDHPARKPNPGMLLAARELMGISLERSWIVGDRASDLKAGRNAGLAGGIHVMTGHGSDEGERDKAMATAEDGFIVHSVASIADAGAFIPLFDPS
ncbi:MAG: HAD family hydrolase [Rhodospirillales bacterium]|nr:HAD family hydrolase [Rhodospirillales bacterium]